MSLKYTFSGHESFQCRHLWLKKGYDFIKDGNDFNEADSVVKLGVGKNMVHSIRFWMRAFGMTNDKDELQVIADFLFDHDNGVDPYLEDRNTLWLLHYNLITSGKASIYNLFFNNFWRVNTVFHKDRLTRFVKSKCLENNQSVSPKTIETDVNVFLKSYARTSESSLNLEDDLSGILLDLALVVRTENDSGGDRLYKINSDASKSVSAELLLFALLSNPKIVSSVDFTNLLNGENSIGNIFCFDRDSLQKKLKLLAENFTFLVYKEDAGIRTLQFNEKPDKMKLLKKYYKAIAV